jgi:hypothetical protein
LWGQTTNSLTTTGHHSWSSTSAQGSKLSVSATRLLLQLLLILLRISTR